MEGFPLKGPQPRIAAFLRQMGAAYEILAMLYELDKHTQEEIYSLIEKRYAEKLMEGR